MEIQGGQAASTTVSRNCCLHKSKKNYQNQYRIPKNFNNFLRENINLLNLQTNCYNLFILFKITV